MSKIIAIVGPTASGKSSLGVFLAQKLRGEVVSADSRQVYKSLDIGTGKITKKEMRGIPHHLLDVANPERQFSANDFVKISTKVFSGILKNSRIPIVVGGTGFYIDALLGRINLPNVPPNKALRAKLKKKSAPELFSMLKKLDPARAKNIDKNNPVRLIRAIEIARGLSKKNPEGDSAARPARGQSKFSAENLSTPEGLLFEQLDILWIGLNPKDLKKRIHTRLLTRMKAGMIQEAKRLHAQGLTYKRMEELGLEYRYLAQYLQKKITLKELKEQIEAGNKDYAKRQMTWFKRNKEIQWVKNKTEALRIAKKFLGGR